MCFVVSCASTGTSSSDMANNDTQQKSEKKVAKRTDGYRCKKQKTTGSNLKSRICTTKVQRDEAKKLAEETMSDVMTKSHKAHGLD